MLQFRSVAAMSVQLPALETDAGWVRHYQRYRGFPVSHIVRDRCRKPDGKDQRSDCTSIGPLGSALSSLDR